MYISCTSLIDKFSMKFYLKTNRYLDNCIIFLMRHSLFVTLLLCRNALAGIITNGGLPSLYAGWGAVLCRNVPHSIIKVRVILDTYDLSSIEATVLDQFCHILIFSGCPLSVLLSPASDTCGYYIEVFADHMQFYTYESLKQLMLAPLQPNAKPNTLQTVCFFSSPLSTS